MFGLQVTNRDPRSGRALVVTCRFCTTFGRERPSEPNASNRYATTVKSFKPPFRTDNFRAHVSTQHQSKWREYCDRSGERRDDFFTVLVPYSETIVSHFGQLTDRIVAEVNAPVVDIILKGMLLSDGCETVPLSGMVQYGLKKNNYRLELKEGKLFKIILDQIALGLNFRAVSRSLSQLRQSCALSFLNNISELKVCKYVQAITAVVLQRLSELLSHKRCWAFSIAFDGATNRNEAYLDVRARFSVGGKLANVHVLAVPMPESHSGQRMFEVICELFRALVGSSWEKKLIGIASDGAANMTGCHSGAVTRLENIALPGLFRIWCGAHQLDLVVKNCISDSMKECFFDPLVRLITYLRRQHGLRAEMRTTCPTVAFTRWLSLGAVLKWFVQNRVRVISHLEEKLPSCTPSASWWALLFAVHQIMRPVDICFRSIQGRDTLLEEQNTKFAELRDAMKTIGVLQGHFLVWSCC